MMSIKPPEAGCLIFEMLMRQLKSPSAPWHGTFSIFTWAKCLGLVRYPEMLPLSLCVCPLPVYIAMAQAGNHFQQRNGLSSALFKDTFTFRFMTLHFVLFYPVSAHSRGPLCDIQLFLHFTEVSQLCSINRLHQHFISTLGAKIVIANFKQINCKTDPGETLLIDGLPHPALFDVISPLATSLLLTWFPLQTLSSPAGVTRLPHGTASIFSFKIQRKEIFHMPTFFQQKFILSRFAYYHLSAIPYVFSAPFPPYFKAQQSFEQQQASLMFLVLPLTFRCKPWFCWSPAHPEAAP